MADTTQLYNLLKEVFLLLDDGDRQLLNRHDLSVPRFHILYHLGREPGASLRRLSELMICDKSNTTRLIQALESEGLVTRRPHESDGRALRIFLSEAGAARRRQALADHEAFHEARLRCLDEIQQGNLLDSLTTLTTCLRASLDTPEIP